MSPMKLVTPRKPDPHNPYYIHSADTVFRVDDYLFRVHSFFFTRESAYFREKLSYARPPNQPGCSDENPIVLDDADCASFACFLWVFYNPRSQHSIYKATLEEWTSILKLANQWQFAEVRALAIRELEKLVMPPVQKIHLYQTYNIEKDLLIHAFAELTTRQDPLTLEEGLLLGMPTFIDIVKAREVSRGQEINGMRSPSEVNVHGPDLQSLLKDVFKLTIEINGATEGGPWSAPILSNPPGRHGGSKGNGAHTVPTTPMANGANGAGNAGAPNGKGKAGDQSDKTKKN
ncbi:hypothetical protein FA95DRAFT_519123 [Auriscalpium vulgare]|uniref:Uncharacterized protein n=1 Tax=Auriscalpium vulgare TaxID=40419 RepID=A0ACB8S4N6_9AGAM|nr:hypothetical protein FA95DRAFT_519123 [Auriscalpium vulgare]